MSMDRSGAAGRFELQRLIRFFIEAGRLSEVVFPFPLPYKRPDQKPRNPKHQRSNGPGKLIELFHPFPAGKRRSRL